MLATLCSSRMLLKLQALLNRCVNQSHRILLQLRPFGRAMAELLMAAVSRGVWAAAAREHSARQQQRGGGRGRLVTAALARIPRQLAPLPPLPPPMVTDNYEANATSCHMQVRGWSALWVPGSSARRCCWQHVAPLALPAHCHLCLGPLTWVSVQACGRRLDCHLSVRHLSSLDCLHPLALRLLFAFLLQEAFQEVIGQASGFKYEARAPQEATFVAQK